jgi:hypothetical protein
MEELERDPLTPLRKMRREWTPLFITNNFLAE